MKFFTPEKYLRLQAGGQEAMDAADTEWEAAVADYERHLERIRPGLPESIRHLLDDTYLHDAEVFFIGRQGNNFVIALRLESPPRDFRLLIYSLLKPPTITPAGWPRHHVSGRAQWLFDEIDLAANGELAFSHGILLSNGWHVQLNFRDDQVMAVEALLPEPNAPIETLAGA